MSLFPDSDGVIVGVPDSTTITGSGVGIFPSDDGNNGVNGDSGSGSISVLEDGTPIVSSATVLNFLNTEVTANGNQANITAERGPQGPAGDDAKVRKYSKTETYPIRELVVDSETGDTAYISQADNNLGNPLTDTDFWTPLAASSEIQIDDTLVKNGLIYGVDTDTISTRTYAEEQNAFRALATIPLGLSLHKDFGEDNARPFTVNTDTAADPAANEVIVNNLSDRYILTVRREDLGKKGLVPSTDVIQINTGNFSNYSAYKSIEPRSNDDVHYVYALSKYTLNGETDRLDTITNGATINITNSTADALSLDAVPTAEADVDLDSNKITNLATPTADADAATKKYVDDNSGSDTYDGLANLELGGSINKNFNSTDNLRPFTVNTDVAASPGANEVIVNQLTNHYTLTVRLDDLNSKGINSSVDILQMNTNNAANYSKYKVWEMSSSTDGLYVYYISRVTLNGETDRFNNIGNGATINITTSAADFPSLDVVPTAEADVDLDGNKITNLATPTADEDASTKQYTEERADLARDEAINEANDYTDTAVANSQKALSTSTPNAIAYTEDTDENITMSINDAANSKIAFPSGLIPATRTYPVASALSEVTLTNNITDDHWTPKVYTNVLNNQTENSVGFEWTGDDQANTVVPAGTFSARLVAENLNANTTLDASDMSVHLIAKVFNGNDTNWENGGAFIYSHNFPIDAFQVQPDTTNTVEMSYTIPAIVDSDFHTPITKGQVVAFALRVDSPFEWTLASGQTVDILPGSTLTERTLSFGAHHQQVDSALTISSTAVVTHQDSDGTVKTVIDADQFFNPEMIKDDSIDADKLKSTNTPTDNRIPSYDAATGGITWVANDGDSSQIRRASKVIVEGSEQIVFTTRDTLDVDAVTDSDELRLSTLDSADPDSVVTTTLITKAKYDTDQRNAVTHPDAFDFVSIDGMLRNPGNENNFPTTTLVGSAEQLTDGSTTALLVTTAAGEPHNELLFAKNYGGTDTYANEFFLSKNAHSIKVYSGASGTDESAYYVYKSGNGTGTNSDRVVLHVSKLPEGGGTDVLGSTGTVRITISDNSIVDARAASSGALEGSFSKTDGVYAMDVKDNGVDIARLDVTDGSNGQVLSTDGSGNLSFVTQSGGQTEAQVKALIADSEIKFRPLGVAANTTYVYKSGSLLSAGEMLTIKPTDINGLSNRQQLLVNLNETNAETRAAITKGAVLRVTRVVSEVLPVTSKSDYKLDDVEIDDAFLRLTVIQNPVRFIAGLDDFFNNITENSDTTYSFEVIAFNDGVGVTATDHPGLMPILPDDATQYLNGVGAWSTISSGGATITVATTPPASPSKGDIWYNCDSDDLNTYIWDSDNNVWVDTSPAGSLDSDDFNLVQLGISATAAELNFSDGVTSAIQTQLDAKPSTSDLNLKADLASPTFSGIPLFPTEFPTDAMRVGGAYGVSAGILSGTYFIAFGPIDQTVGAVVATHTVDADGVVDGGTWQSSVGLDGDMDLGASTARWQDIFATNSTINTSDQNEKQQVRDLSQAELTVAEDILGKMKMFKWNDAVEKKGDSDARWHCGLIAQQVEDVFTAQGLNAFDYGMIGKDNVNIDTDGFTPIEPAIYRYNVRYTELQNFIFAAINQLEAKPTHIKVAISSQILVEDLVNGSTILIVGSNSINRNVGTDKVWTFAPGMWTWYDDNWYHNVTGLTPVITNQIT